MKIKRVTRMALGTFVSISVSHTDATEADNIINHAFEEIERVESLLSVYRESSEISRLNRFGYLNHPSEDVLLVIKKALEYSEITDGAFDITILPVLQSVYRSPGDRKDPDNKPNPENIDSVNHKMIAIHHDEIKFLKPRMQVTLGGIGKGYAVDKAIEILKKEGVKHAIVNAGGDIRVIGGRPNGSPWNIGIRDPLNKRKLISFARMKNQALTTSGVYQRRIHDIFHPKTGRASQQVLSASVISKTAMEGDALSTSLYILGPEKGMAVIETCEGTGAFVVMDNHKIMKSRSWERLSGPNNIN